MKSINRWMNARALLVLFCLAGSLVLAGGAVFSQSQPEGVHLQPYQVYLPLVSIDKDFCPVTDLGSPHNGSTINTLIPLFVWADNGAGYAEAVVMEVYRDPSFTNAHYVMELHGYPGLNQFRFNFNFVPDRTYYWRVYNICQGKKGPYSATWSFTVEPGAYLLPAPELLAPPNHGLLPGPTTTFDWSAVGGAVEYLVSWTYKDDPSYGWNWEVPTHLFVWGLTPDSTYEWWVAARTDSAIGVASPKWFFTTPAQALSGLGQPQPRVQVEQVDGRTLYRVEE